jgi:hypothetical protein
MLHDASVDKGRWVAHGVLPDGRALSCTVQKVKVAAWIPRFPVQIKTVIKSSPGIRITQRFKCCF